MLKRHVPIAHSTITPRTKNRAAKGNYVLQFSKRKEIRKSDVCYFCRRRPLVLYSNKFKYTITTKQKISQMGDTYCCRGRIKVYSLQFLAVHLGVTLTIHSIQCQNSIRMNYRPIPLGSDTRRRTRRLLFQSKLGHRTLESLYLFVHWNSGVLALQYKCAYFVQTIALRLFLFLFITKLWLLMASVKCISCLIMLHTCQTKGLQMLAVDSIIAYFVNIWFACPKSRILKNYNTQTDGPFANKRMYLGLLTKAPWIEFCIVKYCREQ